MNSQYMQSQLVQCERAILRALQFNLYVYPEEIDAAYRCLVVNGGSNLHEMWRQLGGAWWMAVLECTNRYSVEG